MGILFSNVWDKLFKIKDVRMIMVGLDSAGKTTIMYKLKYGEVTRTIPTIGFNVETLEYKKLKMTLWDIGGQDSIRKLWKHYYENSEAIIFVVDSSDTERVELATEELFKICSEESLKNAPVLVFANKQDLPGAFTSSELSKKMNLSELKGRQWLIQGCSAVEGKGLTEGLDWMANALLKKK